MKTLSKHLSEKFENENFKNEFNEEKKLIELSMRIHDEREKTGLSQNEEAKKAHISQQQLSKIENGQNCNLLTVLKVCKALGLKIDFIKESHYQSV